jgi:ribonuclease D
MSHPYHLQSDLSEEQLRAWLALPEIAVDTELHGLRLGRDQVLLIQVGDHLGNVALVRTVGLSDCPPRLRVLLEAPQVLKLFHFAISDLAFLRQSLGIRVAPFFCTRTASRLVRTYTQSHGLKDLVREFLGVELDKQAQQTDWSRQDLTPQQLKYAANDVVHLVALYRCLVKMLDSRPTLPNGFNAREIAQRSMAALEIHVELLLAGYGADPDGWRIDLFEHS